ncbi:transcriptional regulation of mitochondrial recombination-domain-containing protein [Cercophora samala]|uniref:Large ribosomal subunit protein mL67 n=1 Tax=Cercophora samala TaxID=330535 RepID=A0AA40DEE1_9PEZI|nr:transcriptional regulation of mitochondrial recombination-domain-containing protein [Cercophora samala]
MNSLCTASRLSAGRPLLSMVARRPAAVVVTRRPTLAAVVPRQQQQLQQLEFVRTNVSSVHEKGGWPKRKKILSVPKTKPTAEEREARELAKRDVTPLGEKIYLWNHIQANYVLWSTTKELRANKALRQVQFTGKKNTLIKVRKDYWRPMATVQFPAGEGEVGLSVYQKLVELKKRHELEWDDGGEEAKRLLNLSKKERGRELNDQKGNSVADLAFILAGGGKGNKVVVNHEDLKHWRERVKDLEEQEAEEAKEEEVKAEKIQETPPAEPPKQLHKVRVFWANELDHHFAESWSDNVEHVLGLPQEDWTNEDLDKLIANQERLVELHADLKVQKMAKKELKAERKAKREAAKQKKRQPFKPTPEGESGWKSRPRAPKPFTGKAPKWANEGL